MGHYLSGTNGFSYRHPNREFVTNILDYAPVMDFGGGFVKPIFWAFVPALQDRRFFECVPLAKLIVADTKAKGEIDRVARYPDRGVPIEGGEERGSLDVVQYGLAEQVLEVVRRVDDALEHPAAEMSLMGLGAWGMTRDEYPKMIEFVNSFLPKRLALTEAAIVAGKAKGLARGFEPHLRVLKSLEEHLGYAGFNIICHALWNELPRMDVWDRDPVIEADEFWDNAQEWGPPWLGGEEMTAEQRWVWGVVNVFRRQDEIAMDELAAALGAGEPRAERWLSMLNGP
jgi:hypothetical protein